MTVDTSARPVPGSGDPYGSGRSAGDAFEMLDQMVHAQPQQVIVEGKRLLQQSPDDPTVGMHVWTAIGRALYELGDMHRAPDAMRRALHFGESIGAAQPIGELVSVRVSAAAIFAESGQLPAALAELDRAEEVSAGAAVGRIQSQRAFILSQAGRLIDASQSADLAEKSLRRSGDRLGILRLLVIRSLIELQRGDLVTAEADLLRARRSAKVLGQDVIAAGVVANLGVVHARAGKIVVALQHFDEARDLYVSAGSPLRMMAVLEADRAEALLRAGLFEDAVAAAHAAVARAGTGANSVSRGDVALLLARTQLAAGLFGTARRTASEAARLLRVGRRTGMALQANAIGIQAALASVKSDRSATNLFGRSRLLGARLEREGWVEMSDDLRCARLRCASRIGLIDDVEDDLETLRSHVRSHHPAIALRAWYAEALAHRHTGEIRAAMRSARQGMRALDRYRRSTDDLQIRAGLSSIGDDLASLAIDMAVSSRSPSEVLAWAERTRASAFRVLDTKGSANSIHPAAVSVASIRRQLRGRVLVEFVIDGDQLFAVVVRSSSAQLVPLGPLAAMLRSLDQLSAWMDRASQPHEFTPAIAPTDNRVAVASHVALSLGRLLIEPLDLASDADLVIVPIERLHAVPWSALPQLQLSTVTVHLSARMWIASDRRARARVSRSVGLIIGPDIAGANVERASIRRSYRAPTVAAGAAATAGSLSSMLKQCDVVQVAAHGRFRSDRPLSSTLMLHGGEMAIYELDNADVSSDLVVLSSCEAGMHRVSAGGEALGLVAILLSRGVSTVLAPIHVVSDVACAEFVADFHREWATGSSAAQALAIVRQRWLESPRLADWATTAAFTCFGSGSSTVDSGA